MFGSEVETWDEDEQERLENIEECVFPAVLDSPAEFLSDTMEKRRLTGWQGPRTWKTRTEEEVGRSGYVFVYLWERAELESYC